MTIAPQLQQYLDREKVIYDLIEHPPSDTAMRSAYEAGIPPERVAKAVLLDTPDGPLLAVLPADCRIEIADLRARIGQTPRLTHEGEVGALFSGCAPGAIPPVGYDLPTIVETHLDDAPDVYFEAGDHCSLVHMDQSEFARLTQKAPHARFARSVWLLD